MYNILSFRKGFCMKRIKLKKLDYVHIQSRKYDWSKLDKLICEHEVIEIACPNYDEARTAYNALLGNKARIEGVYTVSQDGTKIIVDATGGESDGR